jgi:hypothetical protein
LLLLTAEFSVILIYLTWSINSCHTMCVQWLSVNSENEENLIIIIWGSSLNGSTDAFPQLTEDFHLSLLQCIFFKKWRWRVVAV